MVPLQHKEVEEGSKRERELQQLRSMRTVRDLELQKTLIGPARDGSFAEPVFCKWLS